MTLGEKIRRMRVDLKIYQSTLAKALGITQSMVSQWENNVSVPSYETLKKLEEFCKKNRYNLGIFE